MSRFDSVLFLFLLGAVAAGTGDRNRPASPRLASRGPPRAQSPRRGISKTVPSGGSVATTSMVAEAPAASRTSRV